MSFINYDNPEYQRMLQRAMANPLARSNPSAMQRKIQRKFVDDRMKQKTALENVMLAKARMENEVDFQGKKLGLEQLSLNEQIRSNQAKEAFRSGELAIRNKKLNWDYDDMNKQALYGLLPMGYAAWESARRNKLDQIDRMDRQIQLGREGTDYINPSDEDIQAGKSWKNRQRNYAVGGTMMPNFNL